MARHQRHQTQRINIPAKVAGDWQIFTQSWDNCTACAGCARDERGELPVTKTRSQVVHYRGYVRPQVLFIGEAPGRSEDATGWPFLGKSGDLLDPTVGQQFTAKQTILGRLFDELGWSFSYGITNTVCCLPLDENGQLRKPNPDEADNCSAHLLETLRISIPNAVVYLGQTAGKLARNTVGAWVAGGGPKTPLNDEGIFPALSIHHPAYLLRQGADNSGAYNRVVHELRVFCQDNERQIRRPNR